MNGPRKEPLRTRLARWRQIGVLLVVVPAWMGFAVPVELGVALRRAGSRW